MQTVPRHPIDTQAPPVGTRHGASASAPASTPAAQVENLLSTPAPVGTRHGASAPAPASAPAAKVESPRPAPASAPAAAQWFALRTRAPQRAATALADTVGEIFLPLDTRRNADGHTVQRPLIPRVLFVRTTADALLRLEAAGRADPPQGPRVWAYRNPRDPRPQPIHPRNIHLLRLLTADPAAPCRIYSPATYTPGQRVRVTAGPYAGYEGTVRRIARNRHVVVSIQGLCLVLLPFIHPDLLSPADAPSNRPVE